MVLPVEWMIEGLADAATSFVEMIDTGPSLAGTAAIAIALVPGKVADKALEPVVKKLDDVADAAKSTVTQGAKKVARDMDLHKVACFKKNKKGSADEYDRQLKGQQDGINNMTVKEYLDNRESYKAIGRKGTGAAQEKARKDFKEDLINEKIDELNDIGVFGNEAAEQAGLLASKQMKTLNALHNPDMIAGGIDEVFDLGDASVNKSIGSNWKNKGFDQNTGDKYTLSRVEIMDNQAEKALQELGPDAKMNVDLHRCK
jgi:hypothetical protein